MWSHTRSPCTPRPRNLKKANRFLKPTAPTVPNISATRQMMSALSENDLIQIIKNGAGDIPAFGKDFTDDEALAVAAYIRSLTFARLKPRRQLFLRLRQLSPLSRDSVSGSNTPAEGSTPQAELRQKRQSSRAWATSAAPSKIKQAQTFHPISKSPCAATNTAPT